MNDIATLNLLSLFLGFTAWVLPVLYLCIGKRRDLFCGGSLALCAVTLFLRLREIFVRVERVDFSGIEDTIQVNLFAATVLLATTLVLNTIALLRKEK